LLELGVEPVIPSKENEDRDARPVAFDKEAYRRRNIVERLIGWLKESVGGGQQLVDHPRFVRLAGRELEVERQPIPIAENVDLGRKSPALTA
jgi:hypothetical protein